MTVAFVSQGCIRDPTIVAATARATEALEFNVPDTGNTLSLFGFAIFGLIVLRRVEAKK